jgi:hypothetical protein
VEEKHSECPNNAFKINGVTFNKYGLTIAKTIVLSNNQFNGVLMVELAAMLDITINKWFIRATKGRGKCEILKVF